MEVFSKSYFSRPYEHSDEEIQGMSDLVHACHAASGAEISCNEEWYYTPVDAVYQMPWHVLIKWRVNTAAGFEGGTSIYINPIAPFCDTTRGLKADSTWMTALTRSARIPCQLACFWMSDW